MSCQTVTHSGIETQKHYNTECVKVGYYVICQHKVQHNSKVEGKGCTVLYIYHKLKY